MTILWRSLRGYNLASRCPAGTVLPSTPRQPLQKPKMKLYFLLVVCFLVANRVRMVNSAVHTYNLTIIAEGFEVEHIAFDGIVKEQETEPENVEQAEVTTLEPTTVTTTVAPTTTMPSEPSIPSSSDSLPSSSPPPEEDEESESETDEQKEEENEETPTEAETEEE